MDSGCPTLRVTMIGKCLWLEPTKNADMCGSNGSQSRVPAADRPALVRRSSTALRCIWRRAGCLAVSRSGRRCVFHRAEQGGNEPDALPEQAVEDRMDRVDVEWRRFRTPVCRRENLALRTRGSSPHGKTWSWSCISLILASSSEAQRDEVGPGRSFEYFRRVPAQDRSGVFQVPGREVVERNRGGLNEWCRKFTRGDRTVWVDVYPIEGELWFPKSRTRRLFTRAPTMDSRPDRDSSLRPPKTMRGVLSLAGRTVGPRGHRWRRGNFDRSSSGGLRAVRESHYFNMSLDHLGTPS